jgi:hypothetical protein
VSVSTFTNQNGETKASLEVTADDVEFLSAKADNVDRQTGFTKVEDDDLPFGRV